MSNVLDEVNNVIVVMFLLWYEGLAATNRQRRLLSGSCDCAQVSVKGLNNVRVVVKTFSFAELKEKLRSAQESPTGAIVGASSGTAPPTNPHVQFDEAGSLGVAENNMSHAVAFDRPD